MNIIRKSLKVVSHKIKRTFFLFVLPISICNAILTTISIGLLMPFMALVVQPQLVQMNPTLNELYHFLKLQNVDSLVIMFGMIVLVTLVSSNLIGILNSKLHKKFISQLYAELAQNLFEGYMRKNYEFFLSRNSSTLTKNILHEAYVVTYKHYFSLVTILVQSILILFIMSLLVVVNVKVTLLILFLLGGVICLINFLEKGRLKNYSETLSVANQLRFKETNEAFNGIKLIKLAGIESNYSKRFHKFNHQFSLIDSMIEFISEYPKNTLETIAFGGAVIMVLFLFSMTNHASGKIIAFLSLYVFSGYRIMPALQSISRNFTIMRGHKAVFDDVYSELLDNLNRKDKETKNYPINFLKVIKLSGLKFTYPNTFVPFPNEISLSIKANTTVGFVGTTGSGKSTLIDIILGLLQPQSGEILIDGVPLNADTLRSWQKYFGYVPQQIFLTDDTIENNIAFGYKEEEIDREKLENAVEMASLKEFIMSLPLKYKTLVGERGIRLSGGQIQRIAIARALYNNPKIVVFDEATSSLDGITEEVIIESIKKLSSQKTMIIIAHRLTTVRDCDVIYLLEKGEIIDSGSYDELILRNDRFRRMSKIK